MTELQRRTILTEAVNRFGKQQWFRDVVVHDAYPTNGEATIEFKVNYIPLFERKIVKEFALEVNLADRYTIVDKNGKPVE